MRAKSFFLLLLALGCGSVASIGISQAIAKRGKDAPELGETKAIFVAMQDIPTGDVITAELIKLEEWPVDKIPEGALTRLEEIEGERPKSKIYAGSPILERQLGGFSGATDTIPEGYRAIPVRVDSVSGGSNMIHPGDRVDVSVHLKRNPAMGIPNTEVRLVLQDVKVFAVNDIWEMDPEGNGQTIKAQTISLLVTPTQAQKVILAEELGKIRLVMRSPGDTAESESSTVTVAELFEESERGDRDQDSPSPQPEPGAPDGEASEFLEFLAGQQPPELVEPTPPGPSQVWKMRAIEGDEVREVVLALDHQASPPGAVPPPSPSGFSFWKLISGAAQAEASDGDSHDDEDYAFDEEGPDEDEEASEEDDATGESDESSDEDDEAEDGLATWLRARAAAAQGQ